MFSAQCASVCSLNKSQLIHNYGLLSVFRTVNSRTRLQTWHFYVTPITSVPPVGAFLPVKRGETRIVILLPKIAVNINRDLIIGINSDRALLRARAKVMDNDVKILKYEYCKLLY